MNTLKKSDLSAPFRSRAKLLKTSLLATALSMADNSFAAPITFNTALPVSQGQYIARALVVIDKKSSSTISAERLSLVSVLGYGINAKLTAFAVLPSSVAKTNINTIESRDSAFGDAELFSRYEVLRIDKPGITKRVAPFAGVRFASGKQGVNSDGTTDVFAGVAFTSASAKQSFDAQIRYDLNGSNNIADTLEGQSRFNQGDRISADISWQKRVLPKRITSSTKGFWFAVLESNISYSQRNEVNGIRNNDSGGLLASLSPGLQYSTRHWLGEIAVRLPIIKNINGNGLEPDYTVFTGIRVKF